MRDRCARGALLAAVLAAGTAAAGVEVVPEQPAIPASPEIAARSASLRIGHAEVLHFARSVGTIVVGDAGILDATAVNDSTVILTALSGGRTNVLVLGEDGEVLSRLNVRVSVPQAPQTPQTTVYRGIGRSVLVCNPDCVPVGEEGGVEAPAPRSAPAGQAEREEPPEDSSAVVEPSEPAE